MKIALVFLLFVSQVAWGAKPNYSYHVKIDDPQEANFQEKAETRLLENAKGFYSVLEPTGALRTVTYTADERGFIPVISYTYGHPVKQQVQKIVPAPVIPTKILAQPIRQQVIHQAQPQYIRPAVSAIPLSPQRVIATPTLGVAPVAVQNFGAVPVAGPVRKTLVNSIPLGGGYNYGVSSADNYALSYGTPGFSYHATRKYSHPITQVYAHSPALVQKQIVQSAPLPIPPPAPVVATPVVSEPVAEYGPPNYRAPPVIQNYVPASPQPQYQPQYIPQRVVSAPLQFPVQKQIQTIQPQAIHFQQPARVIAQPQIPLQIPQLAYGTPQYNYRAPEIRQPIQTVSYAPQHVQYAPAPVLKPVQLSQPQIQLTQLSQAQVNYVAPIQQQNIPTLTTQVRLPVPVKQLGNGLRITGNALAVPAANGLKNPLTFAYSYGSGASQVSHSYSGSGW